MVIGVLGAWSVRLSPDGRIVISPGACQIRTGLASCQSLLSLHLGRMHGTFHMESIAMPPVDSFFFPDDTSDEVMEEHRSGLDYVCTAPGCVGGSSRCTRVVGWWLVVRISCWRW